MQDLIFEPINDLERALLQAQEGHISIPALLDIFLSSQFFVLLDKEIPPEGWDNSISLMVLNGSGGDPMLAVFTAPLRSSGWPKQHPQFAFGLLVDFKWLLRGTMPGSGMVVNPGWKVGLEIPPWGLQKLKTKALST
jgi:hypothetical protein